MKLSAWILLTLLACAAASPQAKEPDIKFRLAQSYEQSGDFESASKLYEELLAKDPANFLVIDALHRDYIQLKKYDAAIALVTAVIQRSPNDILWLSRLGTLYNYKADDAKATAAWNRAIQVDPTHESTYRGVASAMMEARLFDRAIDIYLRGRTACKNPALFQNDIAYLYTITLNYSAATKEYVDLVRQNPAQLSYTQSRIAAYIVRPDGLKAATGVVEEAGKSEPSNQQIQQLLAWLYMEAKQYDRAYEVYKLLDATTNAGGHEIFNFAERAFRERGFVSAGNAYRDIMKKFPKFDLMAQVKFGNARTLEELAAAADTSNLAIEVYATRVTPRSGVQSPALYTGAIAAYQSVVAEFPKTDFASRSFYQIAVLKQERFGDPDGALSTLDALEKNAPTPTLLYDARMRKADIMLMKGNLEGAAGVYGTLANQQPIVGEQRERAAMRLAEISYYRGKFDDALGQLEKLTRNAGADITNDALRLQVFIKDHTEEGDSALPSFARGELLIFQQHLTDALALFESMSKTYPGSGLLDEAIINCGAIEIALRRYTDAVGSFGRLGTELPESVLLDAALMNTGAVYESGLRDKQKAIAAYEKLLERFPNSLYTNEARKRIRELRGDIL
jgi:tetratricopeptide (TPR) repeat protein